MWRASRQSTCSIRRNLYVLAGLKKNLAKKSRPPALPIWPHLVCEDGTAIHEPLPPPVAGPSPHAQRTCVCGEREAGNGDKVETESRSQAEQQEHAPKHTLALAPTSNNLDHNNCPVQASQPALQSTLAQLIHTPDTPATTISNTKVEA
jgi:hypothetical protein